MQILNPAVKKFQETKKAEKAAKQPAPETIIQKIAEILTIVTTDAAAADRKRLTQPRKKEFSNKLEIPLSVRRAQAEEEIIKKSGVFYKSRFPQTFEMLVTNRINRASV